MFAFVRTTSFFAPSSFRLTPRLRLARIEVLFLELLAILMVLALLFATPARAANTNFLTERNAAITFPISPPNRATGGAGAIDNMIIGATTPAPGTFSQIIPGGGVPTIASGACGTTTNGTIVAGSTNNSGRITVGAAAATACAVSFSTTLSPVPKACTFAPMNAAAVTAAAFIGAPTGAGFTLTTAGSFANTNWAYQCF
jgi:hypothetical protein